jgi:spore coat protein U-like protein
MILRFNKFLALFLCSFTASANQATTHFGASAIVAGSCSAVSGILNFGAYDPSSANPLSVTGTMTLSCTVNTRVQNIKLNDGQNPAGGTIRQMRGQNTSNFLQYHIYKPTNARISTPANPGTCSGTRTWGGNGAIGSRLTFSAATGTFKTTSATISVCGQIPKQAGAVTDGYLDTVLITVNYL